MKSKDDGFALSWIFGNVLGFLISAGTIIGVFLILTGKC
jgi:hypothetical protein